MQVFVDGHRWACLKLDSSDKVVDIIHALQYGLSKVMKKEIDGDYVMKEVEYYIWTMEDEHGLRVPINIDSENRTFVDLTLIYPQLEETKIWRISADKKKLDFT